MLKIGLTGGSGCGKGEFSKIFCQSENCFSLDTDKTARQTTEKGSACLKELTEYFGKEILNDDGTLNRQRLASLAFTDKERHKKLNSITHFYILKEIEKWIESMERKGARAVIIDAPLLFESGADKLCDVTVGILAPYHLRLERIMKRDGIDEKNARIRLDSQPSDDFFKENCDYILENDTSAAFMHTNSKILISRLLEEE